MMPVRSMAGRQTLDLAIGVRISGGHSILRSLMVEQQAVNLRGLSSNLGVGTNKKERNIQTKFCGRCQTTKPTDEFSPNRAKANGSGLQSWCKACTRERNNHLYATSKKHKERILRSNARRRTALRQILIDHLLKNPCVDCGETDPIVLEFDHIDRANKKESVSILVQTGASPDEIRNEIQKCVVRCANCHRKRTAKQFNWYANNDLSVP